MDCYPLPYTEDSSQLFASLAMQPWSAYLDSSHPYTQQGRYDILAAFPSVTLRTQGTKTTVTTPNNTYSTTDNPFMLLKKILIEKKHSLNIDASLPFTGGAVGYCSYDLVRRIERLPEKAEHDMPIPEMAMGLYDWFIVVDHENRTANLYSYSPLTLEQQAILSDYQAQKYLPTQQTSLPLTTQFTPNMTAEAYASAFQRIQEYIQSGDCYQVNLAQRLHAKIVTSPWILYQTLRKKNPAPYAAWLNTPDARILSLSPEQFLQVHDRKVTTKPIKGTQPRHPDPEEDRAAADMLRTSAKDQAENIMIVDLMRNDLSKNCVPGSVQVPQLCALESFAAVHHLVSTVTGTLLPSTHSLDLLRDAFPGGSITGAPKIRSMEIIEELETHRRSVYCGSIGFVDYTGNMHTNIAIRTLINVGEDLYCYAGGGIVADSSLDAEYQETFNKLRYLI